MAHGVVQRGVLTHADQHRRFLHLQVLRRGREIDLRRRLNSHRVIQKIELVEVHQQDLVLAVEPLQLRGDDPFDRFLHRALEDIVCPRRPELFGELLREGRAATCAAEFENSTEHRLEIHSRVVIEPHILRRY